MTITVLSCEKPCVEWSVVVPRVGHTIQSDRFSMCGYYWNFKLTTTWSETDKDEIWTMSFFKQDRGRGVFSRLHLAAYIRRLDKTNVYMSHHEINDNETEIWKYKCSNFTAWFSGSDFPDNSKKFIFTFDCEHIENFKDSWKIERDHKSVQASCTTSLSKSVQTSPHLDGHICLENLSFDLRKLMDDAADPDVQLRCGDSTIPAHKVILSARSEVFRTMLETDMQEGREGFVEIVDMKPKVLKIFIRYLYTGVLPELTVEIASPLYETGDKYHVKALSRRCGDFLAENLTPANACGILAMADAHSDSDLKDRVITYVLDEKIPKNDNEWPRFCIDHPNVAFEVLNRFYKLSN